MLIGYARVSTDRQDTALQMDALAAYGIANDNIITDTMSGASTERPGLVSLLDTIGPGMTLVVWRIDRLSRSLRHLLEVSDLLMRKGARLVSLCEGIDLGTPAGRMVYGMLGAVAQFERDVIRERTKAGLAAAKARGVKLGAKQVLVGEKYDRVRDMLLRKIPGHRIARAVGCSEATIYKTFPGGRTALLAAASGI
ncbi:MAG: recombinase family protein [Magnetospirillum sp.]|nr:recombinase family protein [Magnetospirillum sp.]